MDKLAFSSTLDNPFAISCPNCMALDDECSAAPFSAPLQLLHLLAQQALNPDIVTRDHIRRVALYLQQEGLLDKLLAQVLPLPDDNDADILSEINDYHEPSFKTAPKNVILDNFLKSAPCQPPLSSSDVQLSVDEISKKSISTDDTYCTETLALVLEGQGKYQQAADIYRKLMAKNPEKSAIFANRLSALDAKVN